jgi:two-component system, cell cycle sensor histidine kinase and response regulator CckA
VLHLPDPIPDADQPPAGATLASFHAALLDAVDQSVILTDLEGRIQTWNAGASRIFGYTSDQMLGRSVAELYPDLDAVTLARDLGRILAGRDFVGEWPGRSRDGSQVWVRIRATLVRGAGGEPVGFLGVARDVTELREAEAALARDRAGLQLIADTAPAYIIRCDAKRRYTFANHAYAERFGLAPELVVGKFIWEVVGDDAYAELRPHVDRVLAGSRVEFESMVPYERIGRQYIHCAVAPELDAAGQVAGLVAVITDISDRKRADLALRESEARLTLAKEAAGLALWSWDPATGETSFSPEFHALYGLLPDATLSFEEWRDRFLHPDDRAAVLEELEAALRGPRPFDGQFRIVRPGGEVRWVVARGRLMQNGGDHGSRLMGVTFDVTRRREADLRLQQLDRLDTVARLAGGVAHEANNQMAVVLGAAGFILRRDDLPEPVRQDAVFIRDAAERTAAITQQLLAFSRRQVIRPRVLDLNATVLAFEIILRRTLGPAVALTVDLADEPSRVRVDEGQLQQVLLNLTLNSRDAMPNGGTLRIETRRITLAPGEPALPGVLVRPGPYVELAVRDTGVGMDRTTMAHLFEPFFTTKGVGRGTGLGLASVYGIVKQSQGYVVAESAPGAGTTMRVLLPLADDPLAPADPAPARSEGGQGTVLVVDDEPVVRAMMGRALQQAGYAVLQAESADAAMARAEEHAGEIHVLVSDLVMPGMSGHELAERLAARHPGLGVLFVSGFPGEEVERRGLLESGRPFLAKPFTPEMLVERVRAVLDALSGPAQTIRA